MQYDKVANCIEWMQFCHWLFSSQFSVYFMDVLQNTAISLFALKFVLL